MRGENMKKLQAVLAFSILAISIASGDVVALKRNTGIVSGGNLDTVFASAISGGTIQVKDGTIQDALVISGTSAAYHTYKNYGATTYLIIATPALYKFDFTVLSGFLGGTVNRAELRLYQSSGNSGTRNVGRIFTHDWIEGAMVGNYPGAAGGVSLAHPIGYNTGANQNSSGGTTPPLASWGDGTQTFDTTRDGTGARGYKGSVGAGAQWLVFDVTDIVALWAAGTSNFGFYQPSPGNYVFRLSEYATQDYQPVLFLDYTPKSPSGTLVVFK